MDLDYEPMVAFKLMQEKKLISDIELTYELSTEQHSVFAERGMKDLHKKIHELCEGEKVGVYVCEPYTFLLCCIMDKLFIVDTHPVPKQYGGTNTGLLAVVSKSNEGCLKLCRWLWRRLYESNVNPQSKQSLSCINFINISR